MLKSPNHLEGPPAARSSEEGSDGGDEAGSTGALTGGLLPLPSLPAWALHGAGSLLLPHPSSHLDAFSNLVSLSVQHQEHGAYLAAGAAAAGAGPRDKDGHSAGASAGIGATGTAAAAAPNTGPGAFPPHPSPRAHSVSPLHHAPCSPMHPAAAAPTGPHRPKPQVLTPPPSPSEPASGAAASGQQHAGRHGSEPPLLMPIPRVASRGGLLSQSTCPFAELEGLLPRNNLPSHMHSLGQHASLALLPSISLDDLMRASNMQPGFAGLSHPRDGEQLQEGAGAGAVAEAVPASPGEGKAKGAQGVGAPTAGPSVAGAGAGVGGSAAAGQHNHFMASPFSAFNQYSQGPLHHAASAPPTAPTHGATAEHQQQQQQQLAGPHGQPPAAGAPPAHQQQQNQGVVTAGASSDACARADSLAVIAAAFDAWGRGMSLGLNALPPLTSAPSGLGGFAVPEPAPLDIKPPADQQAGGTAGAAEAAHPAAMPLLPGIPRMGTSGSFWGLTTQHSLDLPPLPSGQQDKEAGQQQPGADFIPGPNLLPPAPAAAAAAAPSQAAMHPAAAQGVAGRGSAPRSTASASSPTPPQAAAAKGLPGAAAEQQQPSSNRSSPSKKKGKKGSAATGAATTTTTTSDQQVGGAHAAANGMPGLLPSQPLPLPGLPSPRPFAVQASLQQQDQVEQEPKHKKAKTAAAAGALALANNAALEALCQARAAARRAAERAVAPIAPPQLPDLISTDAALGVGPAAGPESGAEAPAEVFAAPAVADAGQGLGPFTSSGYGPPGPTSPIGAGPTSMQRSQGPTASPAGSAMGARLSPRPGQAGPPPASPGVSGMMGEEDEGGDELDMTDTKEEHEMNEFELWQQNLKILKASGIPIPPFMEQPPVPQPPAIGPDGKPKPILPPTARDLTAHLPEADRPAAMAKIRREKNRLAARKCRAKKIACMAVTQQRVAELTEANKELQVQLSGLQAMFAREVQLREALKSIIHARWTEDMQARGQGQGAVARLAAVLPPGLSSPSDVIAALESGALEVSDLCAKLETRQRGATAAASGAPGLPALPPFPGPLAAPGQIQGGLSGHAATNSLLPGLLPGFPTAMPAAAQSLGVTGSAAGAAESGRLSGRMDSLDALLLQVAGMPAQPLGMAGYHGSEVVEAAGSQDQGAFGQRQGGKGAEGAGAGRAGTGAGAGRKGGSGAGPGQQAPKAASRGQKHTDRT